MSASRPRDRGYRFDAASGICANDQGIRGMNRGAMECGDMHGHKLGGLTVEKEYLPAVDLSDSRGYGIRLVSTDLERIRISGGYFGDFSAADSNLKTAQVNWSTFDGINLNGVDLSGASVEDSVIRNAVLDGSQMSRISLARDKMENASFARATLIGAKCLLL
jgi:uncharacterized protein YjbI with pentapeptide repeats